MLGWVYLTTSHQGYKMDPREHMFNSAIKLFRMDWLIDGFQNEGNIILAVQMT